MEDTNYNYSDNIPLPYNWEDESKIIGRVKFNFDGVPIEFSGYQEIDLIKYLLDRIDELENHIKGRNKEEPRGIFVSESFSEIWDNEEDDIWETYL